MGRKKGAINKHHKEKPHKEKKKKGRPKGSIKQKQSQSININIGGGGDDSNSKRKKSSLPVQLPLSVFDPSLIAPELGINNRQPVNPLTDTSTDLLTPFLQAMISNSQQQKIQPIRPKPPTQNPIIQQPVTQQPVTQQPIKPKPPKQNPIIQQPVTQQPVKEQPKPKPEIIKPPEQPPKKITPEDVQKYMENIHEKDKVVELPQDEPKPVDKGLIDNIIGFASDSIHKLVSAPTDKYDGLKMKNKTMPVSKVVKGTIMGGAMGIAGGMAGGSILNNAAVTIASAAGGYIGSELQGETGAAIGTIIGGIGAAKAMDRINPVYPERNVSVRMREEYEEIPNGSLVNGGTVIATGRTTRTTNPNPDHNDTKPLHSRLINAIKETNTTPVTTAEVQQKVKESRILKEIEKKQKYGTHDTNIEQPGDQPSTLENIKEGVKKLYRRLSGKGGYEKVPTHDDAEFEPIPTRKTKKGTYAILPPEEPIDIEQEIPLDFLHQNHHQHLDRIVYLYNPTKHSLLH